MNFIKEVGRFRELKNFAALYCTVSLCRHKDLNVGTEARGTAEHQSSALVFLRGEKIL